MVLDSVESRMSGDARRGVQGVESFQEHMMTCAERAIKLSLVHALFFHIALETYCTV
jgi:hypothetical protein